MTSAVIDRVNVLGRTERSMLVFTDRLGRAIGDYTPTVNEAGAEDESVVNDLYSSIPPAPAGIPGVSLVEEGTIALMKSQEWICLMLLLLTSPQEWIWVVLKLTPPKMLCLMMLFLIRH